MLTICWAAKGGSGTSVTAAALALATEPPSVLVDFAGALPWVLGIGEPDVPGLLDWLGSDAGADRLEALEIPLGEGRSFIHRGKPSTTPVVRWQKAAAHWSRGARPIIVDAGTTPPPALVDVPHARRLLVTRACYLSIRSAARSAIGIDGVILLEEPGRSLGPPDIETALGAPVLCQLLVDPAVARAVDAGLLASRVPRALSKQLRQLSIDAASDRYREALVEAVTTR